MEIVELLLHIDIKGLYRIGRLKPKIYALESFVHFDILHLKIRPSVQKLAPWPRKVKETKLLGQKWL